MDWPLFYRDSLLGSGMRYKVAGPTSTVVLPGLTTLYRDSLLGGAGWSGYKVASPTSTVVFSGFYLDWPLYTGFFARGSWMERV